jgi:hypothetical protein
MRRILILAVSAASLIWLAPSEVSAGRANGSDGRFGQGCCAPVLYSYPSTTYTFGGPHYFNSNLYFYRGYYPYPRPQDRVSWPPRRPCSARFSRC